MKVSGNRAVIFKTILSIANGGECQKRGPVFPEKKDYPSRVSGIVSDTHGIVRPDLYRNSIRWTLHAGDINKPDAIGAATSP
jgi:hypothetical protein